MIEHLGAICEGLETEVKAILKTTAASIQRDLKAQIATDAAVRMERSMAAEREKVLNVAFRAIRDAGISRSGSIYTAIKTNIKIGLDESRNNRIFPIKVLLFTLVVAIGFLVGLNTPEQVTCRQKSSVCYVLRFDVWRSSRW